MPCVDIISVNILNGEKRIIEVETSNRKFIIDIFSIKNEKFAPIKNDLDLFLNVKFNKYKVYWNDDIEIVFEEFSFLSSEIINKLNHRKFDLSLNRKIAKSLRGLSYSLMVVGFNANVAGMPLKDITFPDIKKSTISNEHSINELISSIRNFDLGIRDGLWEKY